MEGDFNLLVSSSWRAPGRSRREVMARLRGLGDHDPLVSETERRGILGARTSLDPRDVVRRLRALHRHAPQAFRYTVKWVPVDVWTAPDLGSLQQAVASLRHRIGSDDRWRMIVERRTEACPPELDIIHALAALIEGPVDLVHPDKILRVEVFTRHAALAVLAPDETFSVAPISPRSAACGGGR
jgi:tRNA(Ser,Leu) C12 N-acetylase TAN1